MKKLVQASIFVFCFSIFAFAQISNSGCPEITVSGHNSLVNPGDSISFTANVKNANESLNLEFEWKVSQGEITNGQGTNQISVATTPEMNNYELTAIVKIKGLNSICNKEVSETAVISNGIFDPVHLDQYGKLSLEDEFARIDNFFVQILNNPKSKGYIFFEIEKTEDLGDVRKRLMSVFDHIKKREFNRDLILYDLCYAENNQTSLLIIPDGVEIPSFLNCERVDIDLK